MKNTGITVLILLFSVPGVLSAEAEDRPVLSVLNFEYSGLSVSEVNLVTDIITSHVQKTGVFRVIDRFQRKTVMDEIAFSRSGCVDESCQLEIGRLLSAGFIITGSLGRVGSLYVMNLRLIAVETGETIKTETGSFRSVEIMVESCRPMVESLLAVQEEEEYEEPEEAAREPEEVEETGEPEKIPRDDEVESAAEPGEQEDSAARHVFGVGAGFVSSHVRYGPDKYTYFSDYSCSLGYLRATWLYRFSDNWSMGLWAMGSAGPQEHTSGHTEDDPQPNTYAIFTLGGGPSVAIGSPGCGFSFIFSTGLTYCIDLNDWTVPLYFSVSFRSVYAGYSPFVSPYVSPVSSTRYTWDEVNVRENHAVEVGYLFGR